MSQTNPNPLEVSRGSYTITTPSLHAARVIRRNFTVKPICAGERIDGRYAPIILRTGQTLDPCQENIAILIDHAVKLPAKFRTLVEFVRETPWYVHAGKPDSMFKWLGHDSNRLEDNLERLRHGTRQLQKVAESLPYTPGPQRTEPPCPAAWYAARVLCHYYEFEARTPRMRYSRKILALMIDLCTDIFRLQNSINDLLERSGWMDGQAEMQRRMKLIRTAVALIEYTKTHLPSPGRMGMVIKEVQIREVPNYTRDQQHDVDDLSRRLAGARSPHEERRILSEWTQHKETTWQ